MARTVPLYDDTCTGVMHDHPLELLGPPNEIAISCSSVALLGLLLHVSRDYGPFFGYSR